MAAKYSEHLQTLCEIVYALKDKSEYLKSISGNSDSFNQDVFDGMAFAYHQVMDHIKTKLTEDGIDFESIGLGDYNPVEILSYKPANK